MMRSPVQLLRIFTGHAFWVNALALSGDNSRLFSCSLADTRAWVLDGPDAQVGSRHTYTHARLLT